MNSRCACAPPDATTESYVAPLPPGLRGARRSFPRFALVLNASPNRTRQYLGEVVVVVVLFCEITHSESADMCCCCGGGGGDGGGDCGDDDGGGGGGIGVGGDGCSGGGGCEGLTV